MSRWSRSKTWTLTLRQQDVKERWEVPLLNDTKLANLLRDEKNLLTDISISGDQLNVDSHTLEIRSIHTDPSEKQSRPAIALLRIVLTGTTLNQLKAQMIALT
ncbi:MAG: hypothetical protein MI861_14130 [Pirellulales bacterium]|nr:hypothetical protein [Pirellulales bacterium]